MKIVIVGGGPGGLYFALLMKKRYPDYDVAVYERNRADDTFGFGVVFSDETLDNLMDYDAPSYQAITLEFSYWDEIDFHFHGEVVRSTGHGFCGTERRTLLLVLHARCRELGVKFHFSREIADLEEFNDADLIVAADGVNSFIRERYKEHFQPQVELRRSRRNRSVEVIVIKFGEKLPCLQLISLFDRNPVEYALRLIGHRDLFG